MMGIVIKALFLLYTMEEAQENHLLVKLENHRFYPPSVVQVFDTDPQPAAVPASNHTDLCVAEGHAQRLMLLLK